MPLKCWLCVSVSHVDTFILTSQHNSMLKSGTTSPNLICVQKNSLKLKQLHTGVAQKLVVLTFFHVASDQNP